MRLSIRVLLGFFLIVGLSAYFLLNTFMQEVKPGVKQGMEVALVDTANLLAELAAKDVQQGDLANGAFARAVEAYHSREYKASIYGLEKRRSGFRVYVTDAKGILLYDSSGVKPGTDYSAWNDVQRTLRGEYGARSSRTNPADETTSTMFVAAPVRSESKLLGVLTVAAPTASVVPYAQRSQRRVLRAGLVLMGACLVVGAGLSWGLTRAIDRMRTYAKDVSEGRRAVMPNVGGGELADLGRALETMRVRLEDRSYVERYVATLTHEMKSPLAAIRGASELLEEEMPEDDRRRFVANIRDQESRLRALLERMLSQASVEQRRSLQDPQLLAMPELVAKVVASKDVALAKKNLRVRADVPTCELRGESFLLEQALSNLLDNAIAYAPEGSEISVSAKPEGESLALSVKDDGPGFPEYAKDRLFEPFYSLPHPESGRKGTGLGLSFVKEVAELHGGTSGLRARSEGGVEAWMRLPLR
jgi:two-component system sensor histidine kinase CreC